MSAEGPSLPSRLWEVRINWHGEIHTFFTTAPTAQRAKLQGYYRLAQTLGTSKAAIQRHVMGVDKVRVKEVNPPPKEVKEGCLEDGP